MKQIAVWKKVEVEEALWQSVKAAQKDQGEETKEEKLVESTQQKSKKQKMTEKMQK